MLYLKSGRFQYSHCSKQFFLLSTNYSIVPELVVYKLCHGAYNQTVCSQLGQPKFKPQENQIYSAAAKWNALVSFAGFFPALILILPLGAMADLVSKKKMLLLPAIVNIVSCLINLFSSIFLKLKNAHPHNIKDYNLVPLKSYKW